jgi:imidazolonepropionase-like amidohydrolase
MLKIYAGTVIDGVQDYPLENQVICVEDGVIQAISDIELEGTEPLGMGGDQVFDASTSVVMPGLIDGHVHALSEPGSSSQLGKGGERALLRALTNLQTLCRSGVTTVRDCGGEHSLFVLRDAIDEGLVIGPRVIASGPPLTTRGGHCHWFGHEADSLEELVSGTDLLVQSGADLVKVMGDGGFSTHGSDRYKPQYSVDAINAVCVRAHQLGRPVAIHVHSCAAIRNAVEAGVDTIEHCTWLGPDDATYGTCYDPDLVDEMAERNIYVSCTFGGAERGKRKTAQKEGRLDQYLHERDTFVQNRRKMLLQGVRIFVGTDAGAGSIAFASYPMAVEDFVFLWGLKPIEAIRMATIVAAQAIGVGDSVGSLEVGKRADMLVLQGNPLSSIGNIRSVSAVFKDGRQIVEHGKLCVDES